VQAKAFALLSEEGIAKGAAVAQKSCCHKQQSPYIIIQSNKQITSESNPTNKLYML
jgi:hypothetical protein